MVARSLAAVVTKRLAALRCSDGNGCQHWNFFSQQATTTAATRACSLLLEFYTLIHYSNQSGQDFCSLEFDFHPIPAVKQTITAYIWTRHTRSTPDDTRTTDNFSLIS